MRRLPSLALLLCLVAPAGRGSAADGAPPDLRDALLAGRAARVGRNVANRHLTPEGLLAYVHRRDATPEQLSADALKQADTGIWTGCYAASLACRYAVTRDPEALALCRRVAAGLDLLSAATGVPGCVSRAVGRPIPGEDPGKHTVPSPLCNGLWYRRDPSRDTLSGIVLGWTCLARFVDDAEVRAYASRNLGAIARRLADGGMRIRDADGKVTTHGVLEAKSALLFENGCHAGIGCGAILAGRRYAPGEDMERAWRHLERKGWVDALDAQYTWLDSKILHASNANMTHLGLTVTALEGEGRARRLALEGLRDLRRKTRGWQNGGYMGMYLLAGGDFDREGLLEELRSTLTAMTALEVPWKGTMAVEQGSLVPIDRRPVGVWAWKQEAKVEEIGREGAAPDPERTFTRADFLFAYWLARAAGALAPD